VNLVSVKKETLVALSLLREKDCGERREREREKERERKRGDRGGKNFEKILTFLVFFNSQLFCSHGSFSKESMNSFF